MLRLSRGRHVNTDVADRSRLPWQPLFDSAAMAASHRYPPTLASERDRGAGVLTRTLDWKNSLIMTADNKCTQY